MCASARSSLLDRGFDMCEFQDDPEPLRDKIRSRRMKILLRESFVIHAQSRKHVYKTICKQDNIQTVAEMGDRLATIDIGRKEGGLLCPFRGGAGSQFNTMWPGPRPTAVPSGILIHPAVWPPRTLAEN